MQALEKDSAVGTEFLRRSCPTHGQRPKLEPVVASFVRTRLIDRQQQTFGNGVSLARRKKRWRFIKAFAARIQAPIDDVHSHPCICLSRLAAPACTIRRGGEPDARYSRVLPCARQTRRASFRYRRPFSS